MNSSFFPGCMNMNANSVRRVARFCHSSPGSLSSIERLPCTTSSCENGRMKFSV